MTQAWSCAVCGLVNDASRYADDCATCRAARPGVRVRPVPEDEAFEPVGFARVLVALLAILTVGVVLAREVRFLQRWGDGPVGHFDLGTQASRKNSLRGAAASLLSYTAHLRAGGDPDPDARELSAIRARARLGSGGAGPAELSDADMRLAVTVQSLASVRAKLAGGVPPDEVQNELSAIERSIREAEELLGEGL